MTLIIILIIISVSLLKEFFFKKIELYNKIFKYTRRFIY